MTVGVAARSISRSVRQQLHQEQCLGRVLAVFERACNLVTPTDDVIALVTSSIGDGPLNIVMADRPGLFTGITLGLPAALNKECLRVGQLEVDLSQADIWFPQPNWPSLRSRRAAIVSHLSFLYALGRYYAPVNALLAPPGAFLLNDRLTQATHVAIQKAGQLLWAGWFGSVHCLREATLGLAGLGRGLTPAGDDFLMGIMLWAWLAHPNPALFCHTLLQTAAPRTTTLSAAFLRAAARGEGSAAWHTLLTALAEGQQADITVAVRQVLAHGATSGADTLAGFLYLAPKEVSCVHPMSYQTQRIPRFSHLNGGRPSLDATT